MVEGYPATIDLAEQRTARHLKNARQKLDSGLDTVRGKQIPLSPRKRARIECAVLIWEQGLSPDTMEQILKLRPLPKEAKRILKAERQDKLRHYLATKRANQAKREWHGSVSRNSGIVEQTAYSGLVEIVATSLVAMQDEGARRGILEAFFVDVSTYNPNGDLAPTRWRTKFLKDVAVKLPESTLRQA